jgi:hypothetical protein
VKKERGWAMTLVLIAIIGSGILEAVIFYLQRQSTSVVQAPVLLGMGILHAILNIIAAVGIWNWKKWGVYLYAASAVLGVVIGVLAMGGMGAIAAILPVVILGYLVAAKWSWFE